MIEFVPSGSCRILQPYPNFDTDCSLEDLCQNSIFLLIFVFALEHFGTVFVTGTYWNRKKINLQKDCQHIVGKKIETYSCCKSCMKKNGSISEKEEWRRLEGKNPTKWHWEKGSWRWGLAKIEALQNGSGIFICFIKSWMHWFDHFLTKLSKYLWIKTGDRHYHFVEPWVIDRPFCRMETLYRSHFVETGVGSLQNGAPQPPQGNGKEDGFSVFKGLEGFRAGKRQTWTPIRSHWCVALGCLLAARELANGRLDAHKKLLMCGFGVAVGWFGGF